MGEGGLPVGRVGGGRAACPTRVAGWLLCHPLTSISLFFRPSAFGARPEVGRTARPACAGAVSGTRRDGIAMSALCAAPPVCRRLSSVCAYCTWSAGAMPQASPGPRGSAPTLGPADVGALAPARSVPVLFCLDAHCKYRTVSVLLSESCRFDRRTRPRGHLGLSRLTAARRPLCIPFYCMFLSTTTPSIRYPIASVYCMYRRATARDAAPSHLPDVSLCPHRPADSPFTSPSPSQHCRRACPPLPP